ncbi:MAG: FAD-dependent oxidoreductase [Clostridia bacterium]|nr:FAD-dependent oxidoreductase [Clostridia bacterium]
MKKTDIVVIGGGAGGLTAVYTALGFNKRVTLIEKGKPGGECTWSGCIPSKALINISKDIHRTNKYVDYQPDVKEILEKIRGISESVYQGESVEKLREDGVEYINGTASFVNSNTIEVNGQQITADKIIITTGSSPFVPPIKGLKNVDYLTNENIFLSKDLPKKILILGGGPIGVELSQALNRIGIEVEIIQRAERILVREESEFAQLLQNRLEKEGVKIHTNANAIEVLEEEGKKKIRLETLQGEKIVSGDGILVATGRKPNIEALKLENANIEHDKRKIKVNPYMQTNVKGIFAIGDVAGPYQFSHMANAQGNLALQNAILPIKRKMKYQHVAWCTYTEPELGRAGMTEKEAKEKYGDKVRVYELSYDDIDRAKTSPNEVGLIKLILSKNGRVLGASILGNRAGEMICEIQVIKTLGIKMSKISKVIHPYPTYSEAFQKIGKRVLIDNIKSFFKALFPNP